MAADAEAGRALFAALDGNGFGVRRAVIAESNESAREAAGLIEEARCVLVCWSRHSAPDRRFAALARSATRRGIVLGIEFEPGAYSPERGPTPVYSFAGDGKRSPRVWIGQRFFLSDILVGIRYRIAGETPPPPTARHRLLVRELWLGFVGLASLAALIVAIPDLYEKLPWPRFRENAEWAEAKTCDDLRDFREHFPNSERAALAGAVLERAIRRRSETQRILRSTDMIVPAGLIETSPSEAEARKSLAVRAASKAAAKCEGFAGAAPGWRVLRATYRPTEGECRRIGSGHVCRLTEAKAICSLEGPMEVEKEECRIPR